MQSRSGAGVVPSACDAESFDWRLQTCYGDAQSLKIQAIVRKWQRQHQRAARSAALITMAQWRERGERACVDVIIITAFEY